MFRRKKIFAALAIFGLLLAVAASAFVLVPDDFDAGKTWLWIRAHHPGLFRSLKDLVIESDRDVRAIGQTRNLPLFRLRLSRKDIAHFVDLYEKFEDPQYGVAYYSEHNLWRNAILEHDGQTFEVKIKSHGRNPSNHRNGKYISLSVKLPRGEQIENCRRFSLLVRDHFRPEKQVVFDLAKKFDLLMNQEKLVRVAINNWDEKLYFFDRRFNDAFMETAGRSSLRIFGYSDSPDSSVKSSIHTAGMFDPEAFKTRFLKTLIELEYPEPQHQPLCDRFLALNTAIAEQRVEAIEEFFDLDYLASFEAVRMIAGLVGHSIGRPDNLYVFYDTANGLFYPAITRDTSMSAMRFMPNGSPELYVNSIGVWELPLFRMMSQHDRLRQLTYRKIYMFLKEEGRTVGRRHEKIREQFDKLSYYGWAAVALRRLGMLKDDYTTNNLTVLKAYLEQTASEVRVTTANDNKLLIEIKPNSLAAVQIQRLRVAAKRNDLPPELPVRQRFFVHDEQGLRQVQEQNHLVQCQNGRIDLTPAVRDLDFATGLDAKLQRRVGSQAVMLEIGNPNLRLASHHVSLGLRNAVTGQPVTPAKALRQQAKEFAIQDAPTARPETYDWKSLHPTLRSTQSKNRITIHGGEYTLAQDLILPKGHKLIIEAGVTLRLAHRKSVISRHGIEIHGTKTQPVVITAVDAEEPFGTIGVLGQASTKSTIRHLHLSHGFERWVDGVYFSGALSIHDNGEVEISDSTIAANHADDGLNIKYARKTTIRRCLFQGNAADQVDLDVCQGEVLDSRFFIERRKDSNGDGLDISFSRMIISGNTFEGMADKGMSVGERSQVVCRGNRFVSNNAAIAIKDLAIAFLMQNDFQDNTVDMDVFQKKSIFGGGMVCFDSPPPHARLYLDEKSSAWRAQHPAFLTDLIGAFPDDELGVGQEPDAKYWIPVSPTVTSVPPWHVVEETPPASSTP